MDLICRTCTRFRMRWWSFQTKITSTFKVFDSHLNIVTRYQFSNCSTLLSLPNGKLKWFGRKLSYDVFFHWKTVKTSFCLWFFRHVKIRLVPVNITAFICHLRPNGPSHVTNRLMVWFRNTFTGKCYRLLQSTN